MLTRGNIELKQIKEVNLKKDNLTAWWIKVTWKDYCFNEVYGGSKFNSNLVYTLISLNQFLISFKCTKKVNGNKEKGWKSTNFSRVGAIVLDDLKVIVLQENTYRVAVSWFCDSTWLCFWKSDGSKKMKRRI